MNHPTNRRKFIAFLACLTPGFLVPVFAQGGKPKENNDARGGKMRRDEDYALPSELAAYSLLSLVLGRVSNRAVTVSALSKESLEGFFEYGKEPGKCTQTTKPLTFPSGVPVETVLDDLQPDTVYYYRLQWRKPGEQIFQQRPECRFATQRASGSSFTFCVQGDSHPERPQMSDPQLYARTLLNVSSEKPDFHICMGDDFSVEKLREINGETLAQPYLLQRPFFGLIGQTAPLFFINGNHEQSSLFNYNQTDVRHDVAVGTQNARNKYFPMPAPDGFYTGDAEPLKSIGLLRDYYAWTWGDALFVVLDNYWHSPALVDNGFHEKDDGSMEQKGHKNRDWWGITLGDAQYQWFKRTLEQSKAKFKFVFAHHVLGTTRGGIDVCDLYEWGGKNKRGDWEFNTHRPTWEMPIHQLMVKHGVTIFFQGHDHLYARQERDGVTYQEVPMPADQNYMARNDDRYESGIKLPNSGHLRVSVSPGQVKVDYVRSFLPKDETPQQKTGDISCSYTVKTKNTHE